MVLAALPSDVRERILNGAWAEVRRKLESPTATYTRGIPLTFHGGNAEFFRSAAPESILSGPSETGKTIAALAKLCQVAWDYPGAQLAIVRKTFKSIVSSTIQTLEEKVLGPGTGVTAYGGEKPEWYDWPNGSRIWIGGMDNPDKVLSSERDAIFVNQAEELELADWETLLTRVTGRAGHAPNAQLFGDCNPASPLHWIYTRSTPGGLLARFESRHEDNPSLFDPATGAVTAQGRVTLDRLDRLTGFRKARLRHGQWVQAEGVVFDTWSETGNVTAEAEYAPGGGPVYWFVDDGYSAGSRPESRGLDPATGHYVADAHPRVILFVQAKADSHLDVFDESYACLALSDDHLREAAGRGYADPEFVTHGHGAAEIRGRIHAAGHAARQSTASVDESIKEARGAISADMNGWRRLRVHPRCAHLRSEMVSYAYDPATQKPVKAFDHGPEALRGGLWILRFER